MTDQEKNAEEKGDDVEGGEAREAAPESMNEEELRARLEEQFRKQKVSELLLQYMVSLSSLAYMKMGITEDTQDIKDLDQARMAIDGFKALLDSIGDRLDKQDSQALAGALASMQMTFVQVSGGEASAAGEEAQAGSTGTAATGDDSEDDKQGEGPASRLWVPGKE